MSKLRLAVIGVGHLGRIHAWLARQSEQVDLVGVADPSPAARRSVTEETGAPAVEDYHDLVGHIDAAIIATPTSKHHEVALDLLQHGVHVLVEKPIAASVAEADAMIAAADDVGAVLQVGHIERFNPALVRCEPHIDDAKYIEAVRVSGFPFRSTDIGVTLDLMIHDLDAALALVRAPVTRVEAFGVSVLGQHEDAAKARVYFESGCIADFTASRVSYRSERSMQVWTPNAFASIDFAMRTTTLVHPRGDLLEREWDLETIGGEERSRLKRKLFDELLVKKRIDGGEANALADEQADFVESIEQGRQPRVTGEAGRSALALAEQILESIEAHAWDNDAAGRIGPMALPLTPVLRAHPWIAEPAAHREAG